MKYLYFFAAAIILLLPFHLMGQQSPRQHILIDDNWKFKLGDEQAASGKNYIDNEWRTLNLPHDWSIEGKYDKDAPGGGSFGFLPAGTGWYRKHLHVNKQDLLQIISIEFEGVYMNSDVWINGHHLGNYPYGYSTFSYTITPYLNEGDNIIAVRVDNSKQPNSRWYSGSGIYRHVWLNITSPVHIGLWGVYVSASEVSAESAVLNIRTNVVNEVNKHISYKIVSILIDNEGKEAGSAETKFTAGTSDSAEIVQQIKIDHPDLWSVENPYLYKVKSIIYKDNDKVDEVITTTGIRRIEFDKDKGFFLNGRHIKINGACLHHDGGCVGAAVPDAVWERRLEKLKEMGCNAIRTSHNPPSPSFLDLCDSMGFLVMDEPFDEWMYGKRAYGYHEYFDKWWKTDLLSMIRRDRNHPSIILWSAGNEIPEQKDEKGDEILKDIISVFHAEDPSRPVTSALDNIAADGGATTFDFMNALDIVGYNYVDRWHERRELYYSIDRFAHPEWKMIGTESSSNSGFTRGAYSIGDEPGKVMPDYNFRMIDPEQLWKFVKMHDYVAGDFMWTGIDYLGETFWPYRNSGFGVLDLCGFPKDGFYFYKSQWTTEPMIHLFPHWNWQGREGQVIPVLCYSNCDAVELFLNGKSYGEKRLQFPRPGTSGGWNTYADPPVNPTTADLHLQWDVPYQPGTLKAVGKKDGKIVFTEEIKTTGAPYSIGLSVYRDTISAGGQDAAQVEIRILDNEGNVVPTADNLLSLSVEGEGEFAGADNGNPADLNYYKNFQRSAFNGLAFAVIKSNVNKGKIVFKAVSDGLKGAEIIITSK